MPCTGAGTPCGDGVCVEYPALDACRASCTSNADCRADEGYACDPVWKGCVLANAPTIAPLGCPVPPGFGRDPAFAPAIALGGGAEPAVAIADDGTLVTVFEREDRSGLAVARLDHTGRGDGALDTSLSGSAPALVRDGGVLHLVTAAAGQVALRSSRDRGKSWSAPQPLADRECVGGSDCSRPAIATGSLGQRHLLYVAYPASDGIRVRASADGGTSFGPPITALPGSRASLAVSGDGVLHVVALRGSGRGSYGAGDHEILYTTSSDGGRSFLRRPLSISRSGERVPFYFGTPRIEVDSARRWVYVAYVRGGRDGKWDLVIAATKDKGKTWVRKQLGNELACAATNLAVQLALDPTTGVLHLGWYDSRGNRFAHGVCADGLRWCRQLGRINDTPFAGLSLARHGSLAASESTAIVVDGKRRALHAVWSQAVGEQPESRIFHARAKLPLR